MEKLQQRMQSAIDTTTPKALMGTTRCSYNVLPTNTMREGVPSTRREAAGIARRMLLAGMAWAIDDFLEPYGSLLDTGCPCVFPGTIDAAVNGAFHMIAPSKRIFVFVSVGDERARLQAFDGICQVVGR
jgi:hypothetical protein